MHTFEVFPLLSPLLTGIISYWLWYAAPAPSIIFSEVFFFSFFSLSRLWWLVLYWRFLRCLNKLNATKTKGGKKGPKFRGGAKKKVQE